MTKKILLLAALAVLSGVSSAQGMGGGFMRMMQGGPGASLQMLRRPDVKEELKLNEDQKGKLDALEAGARQRFTSVFSGMMGGGGGDREAMMKEVQGKIMALMEDMSKEALGILDDGQKKRVKELAIQSAGSLAVLQKDVATELAITPAQKAKIDDLQRLQGEATQGIMEKVQEGELTREDIGPMMEKNTKIMDESVAKILTESQRAKLKALSGAPFAFKDPKPGAFSFGRPGGGR